jgi:hypothetical protein
MYDPARGVIFYPDIEGLPEETLPFQAALLGEPELPEVAQLIRRQAPALVAHELFHHYRHARGQLGRDMWHEELVANTLAVAYIARYHPPALAGGLDLADRVLERPEHQLTEQAIRIVDRLLAPDRETSEQTGADALDMHQTALVHLAMVRDLAKHPEPLEGALARLLGARTAA